MDKTTTSPLVIFFSLPEPRCNGHGFIERLRYKAARVNHFRRNPRDEEYMRRLAQETLPGPFEIVDARKGLGRQQIRCASVIVLLWPDAIGTGWREWEREVFRHRGPATEVWVLSGRRRHFRLSGKLLAQFRMRRVLERFWLGEMMLVVALLIISPALVSWDFARRRR